MLILKLIKFETNETQLTVNNLNGIIYGEIRFVEELIKFVPWIFFITVFGWKKKQNGWLTFPLYEAFKNENINTLASECVTHMENN